MFKKKKKAIQMCRVSDVSGISLSFQIRIGRCLEGEKKHNGGPGLKVVPLSLACPV